MIDIELFDFQELPKLAALIDEFVASQKELNFKTDYRVQFGKWLLLNKKSKDKCVLAAKDGDTIAGILIGSIVPNHPMILPEQIGYIDMLIVLDKYRRQGIGRLLLDKLYVWFISRQISDIHMLNLTYNETAKNFWAGCGYEMILDKRVKYLEVN